MSKILVIAAHPDDEIMGCGGIIKKYGIKNILIMDAGRDDPIDQKFDTLPLVHWITKIEERVKATHPKIIYTHFAHDLNRDHQITHEATMVACRPQSGVKEVYAYETFSSSYTYEFKPDTYVKLTDEELQAKVDAMVSNYSAELRPYPHPRSIEGITTLAVYRGMQVDETAAEAFVTIRRQV